MGDATRNKTVVVVDTRLREQLGAVLARACQAGGSQRRWRKPWVTGCVVWELAGGSRRGGA
jgi:hypothetical protein